MTHPARTDLATRIAEQIYTGGLKLLQPDLPDWDSPDQPPEKEKAHRIAATIVARIPPAAGHRTRSATPNTP